MIEFCLTQEQQMLRDVVARFVREQCNLQAHRASAASAEGFERRHWQTFAELGWLGLFLDEEVGGLGASFVEVAIVMEEFGRGLVREPFLSTAVLCARLLDRADARETRRACLTDLTAGQLFVALAHSEHGARYELGQVESTVATRTAQGFRLDGEKTMAFGASAASKLIVSARLADDAARRFGLFVVDVDLPGVTMNHYPLIDYSRAADVRLDAVMVSADAQLVGVERAAEVLDEAIDLATLASVAEALGCMETVLELTSEYLKTRVQFGQALAKFQALQHRMAEMFIEVQESRSILVQGLVSLDRGDAARRAAVSAAKAFTGKAGKLVGELGVQLHGGIGVTEEARVGHYYKKLVMFEKVFGDTAYHLDRFARCSGY